MLTAAKAREITEKASKNINSRELRNIEQKIAEAAQKGQSNITVYNIHETTMAELEAMGYEIHNIFYRNDMETIVSWKEG